MRDKDKQILQALSVGNAEIPGTELLERLKAACEENYTEQGLIAKLGLMVGQGLISCRPADDAAPGDAFLKKTQYGLKPEGREMVLRGTGRTSKTLKAAGIDALYILPDRSMAGHTRDLAKKLGREDISFLDAQDVISGPKQRLGVEVEVWVDHAVWTILTPFKQDELRRALERIGERAKGMLDGKG